MNERQPRLSWRRLLPGLALPLAAYLLVRVLTGSAVDALALTEAAAAAWLLIGVIVRHRLDWVAAVSAVAVALSLAGYALTGGDPLALELRRGAVTGTVGIVALASVVLGRPLLLVVVERIARLHPERRREVEARLQEPDRRRALAILTALIGLTFAIDGAVQVALALTVSTGAFVADSTAARVVVLGSGLTLSIWAFRRQKERRERRR